VDRSVVTVPVEEVPVVGVPVVMGAVLEPIVDSAVVSPVVVLVVWASVPAVPSCSTTSVVRRTQRGDFSRSSIGSSSFTR
jgi:hypothetical protein